MRTLWESKKYGREQAGRYVIARRYCAMGAGHYRKIAVSAMTVLVALMIWMAPVPAQAQSGCARCSSSSSCVALAHVATRNHMNSQHILTRNHIAREFETHRNEFIVRNFFIRHILPAMMMMTEQLTTMSMTQILAIGTFFDAEIQLDTQRQIQELTAKAHKDYQPSFEMCTIGTMGKNLAASRQVTEFSAFALHQGMMDRQTLNYGTAASGGTGADKQRRWFAFIQKFCDPADNSGALQGICNPATNPTYAFDVNGDVDYTRIVDNPLTIDADFTESAIYPAEASLFALGSNLYGSDIIDFKADSLFRESAATGEQSANRKEYMRIRGILAKRSVAMNSYANIVGMKASGSANAEEQREEYMRPLLAQLGMVDPDEVMRYMGERPSYYAQMELLTKKIYQRPEFYTNLYDKPANVDRTRAAMRAIGLMQNMDMFNSRLRSEMLLSVAAELQLMEEQERVNDIMGKRIGGAK